MDDPQQPGNGLFPTPSPTDLPVRHAAASLASEAPWAGKSEELGGSGQTLRIEATGRLPARPAFPTG